MARQPENTERINVHLPKEQLEKLRKKAKSKGMPVSGYVRLLILENLGEPTAEIGIDEIFAALQGNIAAPTKGNRSLPVHFGHDKGR